VRGGKEVSSLAACGRGRRMEQQLVEQIAVAAQRQVGMGPASATTTSSPIRPEGESQAAPLRVMPGQGEFPDVSSGPASDPAELFQAGLV
jgi:hypothetical protein